MSRVLLVASSFAPNVGGLQTVTAQLARGLRARGIAVEVLTNKYPRALPARENISGVPVQRLNFLLPRWSDLRRGRADLFLAGLWYAPVTMLRLLDAIRRFKPDAVNLHFVGAPAFFVLVAHWFLKFRLVVSLHGDDVQGLTRRGKFDRWVFHQLVTRADALTAPSQSLMDVANRDVRIAPDRACVIYNAVETTSLPMVKTLATEWATVGRLAPKKGFDVLLRALARLPDELQHLTLVGGGAELETLQALARELQIEMRVDFRGVVRHAEALAVMAASRAIVIPSRMEPFGIVALEAMALGKPVVATCVGGLPEVLRDADAILIEPDNPTALARALLEMVERLVHEPHFGARNRACAARFSTQRMLDAYLQQYQPRKK